MKQQLESLLSTLMESMEEPMKYAILQRERTKQSGDSYAKVFYEGYISAFYRIFTLIEQQAEICGVSLKELGLDQFKESDFF